LYGWRDGSLEKIDGRTDVSPGRIKRYGWTEGRTDGWMDGWMTWQDREINGWKGGRLEMMQR